MHLQRPIPDVTKICTATSGGALHGEMVRELTESLRFVDLGVMNLVSFKLTQNGSRKISDCILSVIYLLSPIHF